MTVSVACGGAEYGLLQLGSFVVDHLVVGSAVIVGVIAWCADRGGGCDDSCGLWGDSNDRVHHIF